MLTVAQSTRLYAILLTELWYLAHIPAGSRIHCLLEGPYPQTPLETPALQGSTVVGGLLPRIVASVTSAIVVVSRALQNSK